MTSTAGASGYVFNFEGGCYAKTIRLSSMYEPDIFATTKRFGTILENVDIDPVTRELDLDSERFTENTRGAYPLHFIGNADPTGIAGTPRNVVFLTADAFGVLPPISRLTREQAAYHFISRLHGQACRHRDRDQGAERHLLGRLRGAVPAAPSRRLRPHAHGPPRAVRRARLAGEHRLDRRPVRRRRADEHQPHPEHGPGGHQRRPRDVPMVEDPVFRVAVPTAVPGVPPEVLQPRSHLGRPGCLRRRGAADRPHVPRELRGLRRRRERGCPGRRPRSRPRTPASSGCQRPARADVPAMSLATAGLYPLRRPSRTWRRPANATATRPTTVIRMSPAAKSPRTAMSAPRNVRTMTGVLAGKNHLCKIRDQSRMETP